MKTIVLTQTVRKGEREISELVFQEPKVRHLLALDGKENRAHEMDVAFVSALTGEPEALIKEVSLKDWATIRSFLLTIYQDVFASFQEDLNPPVGT